MTLHNKPDACNDNSRAILEVERAISDVRRGEAVLLKSDKGDVIAVAAAEYKQGAAIEDSDHPAVRLMKFAGLLPKAVKVALKDCADRFTVSEHAIRHYPESLVGALEKVSEACVPLKGAEQARIIAYRPRFGHEEHLAVIIGDPQGQKAPLVRVHSSCVTGDVFGSLRCDCGDQLHKAIDIMESEKNGIVLYMSQEGRGIGIANKLRAYGLQDKGMDTVEANLALGFEADERDFALASAILKDQGVTSVTLLTNNPEKTKALEKYGIQVSTTMPIVTEVTRHNRAYLATKAKKLGHTIPQEDKE